MGDGFSERKRGNVANLVPFKSGSEWNGNRAGRPKGLTAILRGMMDKTELCGEKIPGGRTVAEALMETALMHAIKGNASILAQIWDRLEGGAKDQVAAQLAKQGVTFEIIENHRNKPAELGGETGGQAPA